MYVRCSQEERRTALAVVGMGYADGPQRLLSGRDEVFGSKLLVDEVTTKTETSASEILTGVSRRDERRHEALGPTKYGAPPMPRD